MNTQAAREALLKISSGIAELALALDQPGTGGGAPRAAVSPAPDFEPSPFDDDLPAMDAPRAAAPVSAPPARLPARAATESAFTKCPAHNKEWTDGKFGQYCTAPNDDPNWSNDKGYCRVTPRSAGAWLKQHPQGAPASAPQDVDDIPF